MIEQRVAESALRQLLQLLEQAAGGNVLLTYVASSGRVEIRRGTDTRNTLLVAIGFREIAYQAGGLEDDLQAAFYATLDTVQDVISELLAEPWPVAGDANTVPIVTWKTHEDAEDLVLGYWSDGSFVWCAETFGSLRHLRLVVDR